MNLLNTFVYLKFNGRIIQLLFIKGSLYNIKHKIIKIKIWDACLFFKTIKIIIMVWCRNVLLCGVSKIINKTNSSIL